MSDKDQVDKTIKTEELISRFVSKDDPKFEEYLSAVLKLMATAVRNSMRPTPTLAASAVYLILVAKGIKVTVPKIADIIGVNVQAIYQRAYTMREFDKNVKNEKEELVTYYLCPECNQSWVRREDGWGYSIFSDVAPKKVCPDCVAPTEEKIVKTTWEDTARVKTTWKDTAHTEAKNADVTPLESKIIDVVTNRIVPTIDSIVKKAIEDKQMSIFEKLNKIDEIETKIRSIESIESKIKEIESKIIQVEEPEVKEVKYPVVTLAPAIENKEVAVQRTKQLVIVDLNHVINYSYKKNEPIELKEMCDALLKSINQEGKPFDMIGYLFMSGNFISHKINAKELFANMLKTLGFEATVANTHFFLNNERKGFLKDGARKFQDVDVWIVDKVCELIITKGKEIRVMHIVSGDEDMLPSIHRAKNAKIKIKAISFDDAMSGRIIQEIGKENVISIV